MGVNTKMFVATKTKNILEVMPIAIKAINKWQREHLDNYWDKKGFKNRISFLHRDKEIGVNKDLKEYTNGIRSVDTHDFRSWNMCFTVHGEKRSLFITHTCSYDFKDAYEGEKIIFSLGFWGMSKDIMMVIGDAIKEYGDIYFVENDSKDEWEQIFEQVALGGGGKK